MLRRIEGLDTLGELDVLTADECKAVASSVLELRESWTARSPAATFCTLGVNAYMDLATAADPVESYDDPAGLVNSVLRERFADLHGALADGLAQSLGMPARYAPDLAMPGFHIWTGQGIPRTAGASVHFDLQYLRLLTRPRYARATGTVSFTLPIMLPAAGSSLRVWPQYTYPDALPPADVARTSDPRGIDYRVGTALVHSGHVLHQIGPTPTVRPDDLRITLQGHGLVLDNEIVLYW